MLSIDFSSIFFLHYLDFVFSTMNGVPRTHSLFSNYQNVRGYGCQHRCIPLQLSLRDYQHQCAIYSLSKSLGKHCPFHKGLQKVSPLTVIELVKTN